MKKVILNDYIFLYADNMTYFFDKRYNNVLFMRVLNNSGGVQFYDDANIIIQFSNTSLKFIPLWNIEVERIDDKIYKLAFDD